MTLGSGYRYLMESVAAGDGVRHQSQSLADYYAASGTPPGVFLGAGLATLDGGRGVEIGSEVSEQHLFNLLGMCADPITGDALGRPPMHSSAAIRTPVAGSVWSAVVAYQPAPIRPAVRPGNEGRERIGGRPSASPVIGSAHIPRRLNRCRSVTSEPISTPPPPSRAASPAPRNTPGGVPDAA